MNPQPVINHGHVIVTHFAGADRVVNCFGMVTDILDELRIGRGRRAGFHFNAAAS